MISSPHTEYDVHNLICTTPSLIARALLTVVALLLAACGSVPNKPDRIALSTFGCIEAAVERGVTAGLPDERAHCLAGASIARYCSIQEAYLAGLGKELLDLFTRGDAQWKDWQADRAGIDCAREARDDAELVTCCRRRGY